ncbi:MAG: hypothetical protein GQ531_09815 [Sulfurovum sp.]|nr:hypothetical protein [Sulfurovum sp.]
MLKFIDKLYDKCLEKSSDHEIFKSLHLLKTTSTKEYLYIAQRMEIQLEYIYKHNENWLKQKINSFFNGNHLDKENFNGLLGEIRVYGELLELQKQTHIISNIQTPPEGSDFIVLVNGTEVHIEINTPQKSGTKVTTTNVERRSIQTEEYILTSELCTSAPYGYPQRDKDNIQYEAISKFTKIKQDKEKKQFKEDVISILWLDLNDPMISVFSQFDYTAPIGMFNGSISSGYLWNAFYSERGDNIYSDYPHTRNNLINMEFNGRFNQDSNIDFVIFDAFTHKVIFENHNSNITFPKDLYKMFFNLYNFNNKNSYLSLNNKNRLKKTIESERDVSNSLLGIIKI